MRVVNRSGANVTQTYCNGTIFVKMKPAVTSVTLAKLPSHLTIRLKDGQDLRVKMSAIQTFHPTYRPDIINRQALTSIPLQDLPTQATARHPPTVVESAAPSSPTLSLDGGSPGEKGSASTVESGGAVRPADVPTTSNPTTTAEPSKKQAAVLPAEPGHVQGASLPAESGHVDGASLAAVPAHGSRKKRTKTQPEAAREPFLVQPGSEKPPTTPSTLPEEQSDQLVVDTGGPENLNRRKPPAGWRNANELEEGEIEEEKMTIVERMRQLQESRREGGYGSDKALRAKARAEVGRQGEI